MANQPERRFSTGAIHVSVWKNEIKDKEGKDKEFKTVTFQKRYKDKEGKWQTSGSLNTQDLPKAMVALGKAYEYLVLREKGEEEAII